jgi:glycosyltransferase involved in cell wall biosynthesis
MKIGVNARFLTKPFTGIGRYTKALFSTLAQEHPHDVFVLVSHEDVGGDFPENVEIVVLPERFRGSGGMRKTYWEQVQLPSFFKKYGVDVVHYPYPSNPWRTFTIPTIVTVHDTIPWVLSEYRERFSTRLYQDRCLKALKFADMISTVSYSTQKDLLALKPDFKRKIFVAENGMDNEYKKNISDDEMEKVLKKYGIEIGRPYFFYLGGYDSRKNVSYLVDAFVSAIAENFDVDLVLAGGKILQGKLYESYDRALETSAKMHGMKGKLLFPGFIDEVDLPALYKGALAFVNVSKSEGFNLPALEALCSGTPVIASDISIHHEVLGDFGYFVKLDSSDNLAELMKKFAADNSFAKEAKAATHDYVCVFNWSKTAQKVYEAYEKLC